MTQMHLVYRSYGGENMKNRPPFYSKALTLASFVLAASKVPDAEVIFVNDGPIPIERLTLMQRCGRIIQISDEPVGMRNSYRFGLGLPDREGWHADDLVSYNEDDYLFRPDAFVALQQAAQDLAQVSYFAFDGERPVDANPEVARVKFGLPRDWKAQPDLRGGGVNWFHSASTASTFSARIGILRRDLPIFYQCMRPFRVRYLDHETCLIYQGHVPYRGREVLLGLPHDFEPSVRGVARTAFLIPFRVALNRRARQQAEPHLLYAPENNLAAHLESELMKSDKDWLADVNEVVRWADSMGFGDIATTIRARLET